MCSHPGYSLYIITQCACVHVLPPCLLTLYYHSMCMCTCAPTPLTHFILPLSVHVYMCSHPAHSLYIITQCACVHVLPPCSLTLYYHSVCMCTCAPTPLTYFILPLSVHVYMCSHPAHSLYITTQCACVHVLPPCNTCKPVLCSGM